MADQLIHVVMANQLGHVMMADQLGHVDSMELVLPSFIALIKRATAAEYQLHVKTHFNRVFKTTRSVQVSTHILVLLVLLVALQHRTPPVSATCVSCLLF